MLDVILHKEINQTRPEQSRRVFIGPLDCDSSSRVSARGLATRFVAEYSLEKMERLEQAIFWPFHLTDAKRSIISGYLSTNLSSTAACSFG